MPVSPQGFEAWIEIEGKRLEEFKLEEKDGKMVCWVPCEAGKAFAIGCFIPPEKVASTNHTVHAYLDGTCVSPIGNIVRQNAYVVGPETRLFEEELVKGDASARTFQFGTLELTDDDSYLEAPAKQFGEIRVEFSSVEAYVPSTNPLTSNWKEDYRAHERAKKGVSHCVTLGEERPRARGVTHNKPVGSKKVCYFMFKYRPMDLLVADGIAPRQARKPVQQNAAASGSTSAPQRVGSSINKRKADEVKEEDQVARGLLDPTDDDIERMETELAAAKAKKAQAAASSSQPAAKRVKKEYKSTLIPGEIIDLTNLPSGSSSRVKKEPEAALNFLPGEVIDLT